MIGPARKRGGRPGRARLGRRAFNTFTGFAGKLRRRRPGRHPALRAYSESEPAAGDGPEKNSASRPWLRRRLLLDARECINPNNGTEIAGCKAATAGLRLEEEAGPPRPPGRPGPTGPAPSRRASPIATAPAQWARAGFSLRLKTQRFQAACNAARRRTGQESVTLVPRGRGKTTFSPPPHPHPTPFSHKG